MTRDELTVLLLVAAFAALVTAHVALVAGLVTRRPWWRALVALPVAPLAPYWGAREGMHKRTVAWVASLMAYAVLRLLAR